MGRQLLGMQASGLVHADYAGRGLDDRLAARGRIVGVASVEPVAQHAGHLGSYLAFRPCPGFGGELVDDQYRLVQRDRPLVGARVGGDHGVIVRVVQSDAVPASRDQNDPALLAAPGLVVVGRELDAPVFVRLAVVTGHSVERLGRQRHQRATVVCEPVRYARARVGRTHGRRRHRLVSFQQQARELSEGFDVRLGDHEIASQVADGVLHVALLVA